MKVGIFYCCCLLGYSLEVLSTILSFIRLYLTASVSFCLLYLFSHGIHWCSCGYLESNFIWGSSLLSCFSNFYIICYQSRMMAGLYWLLARLFSFSLLKSLVIDQYRPQTWMAQKYPFSSFTVSPFSQATYNHPCESITYSQLHS